MKKNEFNFSSADENTRIHAIEWLPTGEPRAVLQVSRGGEEQVQCYEELAEYFTKQGFIVVENAISDAAVPGYSQEALYRCLKIVKKKYPDVPHLLFGLFQGAFPVHTFIKTNPGAVEGVVFAGAEPGLPVPENDLPLLQLPKIKENWQEAFCLIHHWLEERLDEMLYLAAKKY